MSQLPFSQACENNKHAILDILARVFADRHSVLEIGAGTGQHAVYYAEHLTHLHWLASDQEQYHAGLQARFQHSPFENLSGPFLLDVTTDTWPENFDAVFSANTAHIMPWRAVECMFSEVGKRLPTNGIFALYGPFNYNGEFTSDSNRAFDAMLRERLPHQGLRDFEAVNTLATQANMQCIEDNTMPANNRLLVWQKHK